jgi:hypothetical protein
MWYRWEGTYTILMGTPCSSSVHNKIWRITGTMHDASCDLKSMTKNSRLMYRNTFRYLQMNSLWSSLQAVQLCLAVTGVQNKNIYPSLFCVANKR